MTVYFDIFLFVVLSRSLRSFLSSLALDITSQVPIIPRQMVKWRDLTEQHEAFLKTQEFRDMVKEAEFDWHRKLNSILFAYRVRKQASTCINPFMMYAREPILSWEVEYDLGPLEPDDLPELSIDEVIQRMYELASIGA